MTPQKNSAVPNFPHSLEKASEKPEKVGGEANLRGLLALLAETHNSTF